MTDELTRFWHAHSRARLHWLMVACNRNGPQCTCLPCAMSGRKPEGHRSTQDTVCTFKLWFEEQLTQHGFTDAAVVVGVPLHQKPITPPVPCDDGHTVYDVDASFHHLTCADWFMWTYGAKLWNAKSVTDPELQKLATLFQSLSTHAAAAPCLSEPQVMSVPSNTKAYLA